MESLLLLTNSAGFPAVSEKAMVSADASPLDLMAAAVMVSGRPSRENTEIPLDFPSKSLPKRRRRSRRLQGLCFSLPG